MSRKPQSNCRDSFQLHSRGALLLMFVQTAEDKPALSKWRRSRRKESVKRKPQLCKWQDCCCDILGLFQLIGQHLPTRSHTFAHTDPLSGRLWSVMSRLTAGCKNHNKQCLLPADHSWRSWRSSGNAPWRSRNWDVTFSISLHNLLTSSFPGSFISVPNFPMGGIKISSLSL